MEVPELARENFVLGAVQLPQDSELVTDADEEVFLLYSTLPTTSISHLGVFRGLGHVDSREDTLTVKFELKPPIRPGNPDHTSTKSVKGSRHSNKYRKVEQLQSRIVEIELSQDKTALRTRKGDTGSVLWKASVDFARLILQQSYAQPNDSLLDPSILKTQHVVELGAGTGLLAIALSPIVRRYTATDIYELLPLLRKNLSLNFDGWPKCSPSAEGSNVFVEELDWTLLSSTPIPHRLRVVNLEPVDLLLAVDCIYHPSLLPSLIETIDHLSTPNRTAVLIAMELRAHDVTREFLDGWVTKPGWKIWRVGGGLLDTPYVMWLGWREPP